MFRDQPGIKIDHETQYHSKSTIGLMGEKVYFRIDTSQEVRQSAVRSGQIREFTNRASAPSLDPGTYNYLITRNGELVVGKVSDRFERGVKHYDLANGREGVVAGEIKISSDGGFQFNIESGTYSRDLIEKKNVSSTLLEKKAGQALQFFMGRRGKYSKEKLSPDRFPDLSTIRKYCNERLFLALNKDSCCQIVQIGCH